MNTPQSNSTPEAISRTGPHTSDLTRLENHINCRHKRLAKEQRKYMFIFVIIVFITVLCYLYAIHVWQSTSRIPFPLNCSIVISSLLLIMFFTSGIYTDKVLEPSRYMERLNNSLSRYNLHFNPETKRLIMIQYQTKQRNKTTTPIRIRTPQPVNSPITKK
eukprot:gb/GECH01002602.1/.p1 GENE.gb/GECH01002602.1/~~gb/GECH01002602.1/.p1  ORF type:complete len:161 (+),score=13.44 gb/GECH01002602.1/:1-483(+)